MQYKKGKLWGNVFFFGLLITVLCTWYYSGPHGVQAYYILNKQYLHTDEAVVKLKAEIEDLQKTIACYENDVYFTEKIAREQLSMGYPGESIYIVSTDR